MSIVVLRFYLVVLYLFMCFGNLSPRSSLSFLLPSHFLVVLGLPLPGPWDPGHNQVLY